ncbi:MAG: hypothetical protein ACFFCS_16595 [Candidatus Hodarchaeota archaeon]
MSLDDFLGKSKKAKGERKVDEKEKKPARDVPNPDYDQKVALLKKFLKEKKEERGTKEQPTQILKDDTTYLKALENFAEWIKGRTYLRGDLDTAKQMVRNLAMLDEDITVTQDEKDFVRKFVDLKHFFDEIKERDSLNPDDVILSKQQKTALFKKSKGEKLASTDYRHLKLLKEETRRHFKKHPFYKFLADFFDVYK